MFDDIAKRLWRRISRWGLLVLWLCACNPIVPATIPPQLNNTPEPSIALDGERIYTPYFSVAYPADWKIVKSNPAIEPLRLVMVAPDEQQTITVSLTFLEDMNLGENNTLALVETVVVNDITVTLVGSAPTTLAEVFTPIFEDIVASVR